tara:strand:+ start:823 stop:1212 length:390 start_codon:yes stop_codon:yes gene_type:complete
MNNSIKITKPAWNKIMNVLNQTKKPAFFLSLTGGGCNGYSYDFKIIEKNKFDSFINEPKIKSTIIENNGHKVLVDPVSEFLLIGTTIDFEETMYESKFKFIKNKDIAHSCGCGSSFSHREPKIPEKFIW